MRISDIFIVIIILILYLILLIAGIDILFM